MQHCGGIATIYKKRNYHAQSNKIFNTEDTTYHSKDTIISTNCVLGTAVVVLVCTRHRARHGEVT